MRKTITVAFVGIFCILLFGIVLFINLAYAQPTLPTEFYGDIVYFNQNATGGTLRVYINGTLCGQYVIKNPGHYGVLSCKGIDTETATPGGINGDTVVFSFNNNPVSVFGDTSFTSGEFKRVNITVPIIFCGDGFCDLKESCGSCPQDCHTCNGTVSNNETTTTNQTNQTSGGSAGGGSGSGAGSGAGGSGGAGSAGSGGGGGGGGGGGAGGAGSISGNSFGGGQLAGSQCTERWNCTSWTDCTILGIQTRSCFDQNDCKTYTAKPVEVQECTYVANCFDNIQNCHNNSCEEGIDCGGPCPEKCIVTEQPLTNITITLPKLEVPKQVCERHIDYTNIGFWIFLIIIITAMIFRYFYGLRKIRKRKKDTKLSALDRAKKIFSEQRITLLFAITLFFLTLASAFYSYYFLMCPTEFFSYSWMLVVLLILIPLVIHTIMKRFEYSELEHFDKARKLEDVHYQSLLRMIDIENQMLAEEETAIANKLYELSRKDDFKKLLETYPDLKEIYKNLVELYTNYHERKNPFVVERNLCEEIATLDTDKKFKELLAAHPELKTIFTRLKTLYSQYEEKQKIYDQLDEIEENQKKLEEQKQRSTGKKSA